MAINESIKNLINSNRKLSKKDIDNMFYYFYGRTANNAEKDYWSKKTSKELAAPLKKNAGQFKNTRYYKDVIAPQKAITKKTITHRSINLEKKGIREFQKQENRNPSSSEDWKQVANFAYGDPNIKFNKQGEKIQETTEQGIKNLETGEIVDSQKNFSQSQIEDKNIPDNIAGVDISDLPEQGRITLDLITKMFEDTELPPLTDEEIDTLAQDAIDLIGERFGKLEEMTKEDYDLAIKRAQEDLANFREESDLLKSRTMEQYADTRQDLETEISRRLEDLGIRSDRLKEDITRNLADIEEDKQVALGNLNRNFLNEARNVKANLEAQGLTFSGEAIRQLGGLAAIKNQKEGELQTTRRLKQEAIERTFGRETELQETQLSRSEADIQRAIERAQQEQERKLGLLSKQESQTLEDIARKQELGELDFTRTLSDLEKSRQRKLEELQFGRKSDIFNIKENIKQQELSKGRELQSL